MSQTPSSSGSTAPTGGLSRRTVGLLIGLVAVAVLAIGGFVAWNMFFGGDAPPPASIDQAAGAVTGSPSPAASAAASSDPSASASPAASAGASGGSGSGDISGTWTLDTSVGDASAGTAAYVGFRVEEQLNGIGASTAVGTTPGVSGTLTIDGTTLTSVTIKADLSQITTDRPMRDRRVQDALDTGEFPDATFTLTAPVDLGATAATGETINVTATGDLTIHGVTKSVQVPLQAKLVDGVIVVVGSLPATFTDWGITMPTAPIVLSVSDSGTIEMQLFFAKS